MAELEISFEKWTEKYIPDLLKHADNPKVARNLRNVFPSPYTEADAKIWIEICAAADESKAFNRAIVVDGEAVGGIGMIFQSDVYCKTAEIGYWLGEEFWGLGIMTRAVKEICAITFENYDVVRIFAGVFSHNTGSRRVLEKAGFTLEGINKMNIYKNGEYDDSCMYALIRNDFEAI